MRMLPIILAFLLAVVGCQPKAGDVPPGRSSSNASAPTDRGVRLHVWTHAPGNSRMETIEPVSETAIQDAFKKIDWSGPKANHSLVLSLSKDESISIDGVSKPEKKDDTLRAHWTGARKDAAGAWVHLYAEPLQSPETALKILIARFNNDKSIESLASWKE